MKHLFLVTGGMCVLGILLHEFTNVTGVKLPEAAERVAAVAFFVALPLAIISGATVSIREGRAKRRAKEADSAKP